MTDKDLLDFGEEQLTGELEKERAKLIAMIKPENISGAHHQIQKLIEMLLEERVSMKQRLEEVSKRLKEANNQHTDLEHYHGRIERIDAELDQVKNDLFRHGNAINQILRWAKEVHVASVDETTATEMDAQRKRSDLNRRSTYIEHEPLV